MGITSLIYQENGCLGLHIRSCIANNITFRKYQGGWILHIDYCFFKFFFGIDKTIWLIFAICRGAADRYELYSVISNLLFNPPL